MATRMRLSGISSTFDPVEIECLVRTAAEAVCGQPGDLSSRQRALAARAYRRLLAEMADTDPDRADTSGQA